MPGPLGVASWSGVPQPPCSGVAPRGPEPAQAAGRNRAERGVAAGRQAAAGVGHPRAAAGLGRDWPTVGKAADVWGQKRVFLLGLVGVIVFAGLSALAWNAPSLIAFRVLGAGEGAVAGP